MDTSVFGLGGQAARRGRVFVVGSSNEDFVVSAPSLPTPGQTVIGRRLERRAGGKGANQAVAAARSGAYVHFISCVGSDQAGRKALALLDEEGVDASGVQIDVHAPTGMAMVLVADDGENEIVVVPGANATLEPDHVRRSLARLGIGPGDVCLISFEIEEAAVMAAAECTLERGATLLVNPAPARPMPEALLSAGPILLPNRSEALALSGADGLVGGLKLHEATAAPVVMTLGADGAIVVDSRTAWDVPAVRVQVVDSTGAGDTFAGIFASQLAAGADIRSAVERAMVGAAVSVTRVGARDGSPTSGEIDDAVSGLANNWSAAAPSQPPKAT